MTEDKVITEIEKIFPIRLHERDKLESGNRGFTRNQDGSIVGINLCSLKIQDINDLVNLLEDLPNLTTLYLHKNQISDISHLHRLSNLNRLDLSENIISDITPLKRLQYLTAINLTKNRIEELKPWVTDFNTEITVDPKYGYFLGVYTFRDFILADNPIKTPPFEIVKQGKKAIKNYFTQLKEQSQDYLFEAKMIIVGEPGAGKTTLTRKMLSSFNPLPKENETTKGIDVTQYYFPLKTEDFAGFQHPEKLENKNFRLNLWDFGGQEIYKATHRFFLSKRSLYALVADSRNEDTDFNYWLHAVEMFGGESPLLIILNEKHQRKRIIDIDAMRNRFTNIAEVIPVDFAEDDKARLNQLKKAVEYHVSKLTHIGSPIPAKWTVIREALEQNQHNTITLQEYLHICAQNGISKTDDALVLSQYFHDIGVFLHFQDHDVLNRVIFLNPTWATHAVYQILDHPLLNQNNGRFQKIDAVKVWNKSEYELVRNELLHLMKKFLLIYEIANSGEYIVPERLPPSQPEYSWDENNNLYLQYKYDFFMPKGILSQFIVQMNRYIHNQKLVWKRGVILTRDKAYAEVIESYDARMIKIRVTGAYRRDLMTLIAEKIDELNGQYEKMKVEKLIPCNCSECKSDGMPYFFEYRDLKRRIDKGRRDIECGRSYQMVNVRNLIDEVLNEETTSHEQMPQNQIFISYSHRDSEWLSRLQTHLKVLENLGIYITTWDDTKIAAGMKWRDEIEKALSTANVAILLISTDFMASEFITKNELPPILKSASNRGTTVLPIIIKPCLFDQHSKLSEFQSINNPSQPLSSLPESEQELVFVGLAKRIIDLVRKK